MQSQRCLYSRMPGAANKMPDTTPQPPTSLVTVPVLMALAVGGVAFLAALMLAGAFRLLTGEGNPLAVALATGGCAIPAAFTVTLSWILNKDKPLPPLKYETQTTRIFATTEDGLAGSWGEVKLPDSKIAAICEAIRDNHYDTVISTTGRAFTLDDVKELRRYMLTCREPRLAEWRNAQAHNLGWLLTADGCRFVDERATPPPLVRKVARGGVKRRK